MWKWEYSSGGRSCNYSNGDFPTSGVTKKNANKLNFAISNT